MRAIVAFGQNDRKARMIENLGTSEAVGFPETADIETASNEYATRFAGSVGAWMLDVQQSITMALINQSSPASILDVGGGHGQLAIPLYGAGYSITVVGSSESCRHRIRDIVDDDRCRFRVANLIDLPFEDDSFDLVISFRLLTHCQRWPKLIRELCRIARKQVIVDYPASESINAIAPALFDAKKKIEKNTRAWRLFSHREIATEFSRRGFMVETREAQFFLPMVLHRALRLRALSAAMESTSRTLGLTRRWGSPIIVGMVPEHPDRGCKASK